MDTYKIIRFHKDMSKKSKVIATGLTLEETKQHCNNPKNKKTDKQGNTVWFDGFTKE